MSRQRKVKKSLMQKIKKTIHTLTKPKNQRKKTKSRKTTPTKTTTKTKDESSITLQKKLERDLTLKMSQDMQKIKIEMEQELLKKLTSKKDTTNSDGDFSSELKKTKMKKVSKDVTTGKSSTKKTMGKFKPQTDCTLLKLLTLSESLERKVVVGYEVLDNSNQEIWGIDIHEGAKLGRAKKILNTKVKSRKVGSERQYYLVHVTDDTLYYSDEYAKEAIERGRLKIRKYTPELAYAIKSAYDSGYKNNSKLPKL
ncbi:hypothetical protein [Paenibacillus sp. PL91]|uniref:hypothetical protein n=1 Tax=Paenibacillus sp. PL91 TaxID=2729538 RepID=UPI00145C8B5B|nr:hypothetical protein [Paenibacillus sp. PL91]MBC9204096.1 hypothetical protein [Paenibacillus sp. PL91]